MIADRIEFPQGLIEDATKVALEQGFTVLSATPLSSHLGPIASGVRLRLEAKADRLKHALETASFRVGPILVRIDIDVYPKEIA